MAIRQHSILKEGLKLRHTSSKQPWPPEETIDEKYKTFSSLKPFFFSSLFVQQDKTWRGSARGPSDGLFITSHVDFKLFASTAASSSFCAYDSVRLPIAQAITAAYGIPAQKHKQSRYTQTGHRLLKFKASNPSTFLVSDRSQHSARSRF